MLLPAQDARGSDDPRPLRLRIPRSTKAATAAGLSPATGRSSVSCRGLAAVTGFGGADPLGDAPVNDSGRWIQPPRVAFHLPPVPGCYPGRVGGLWLWRTLVLAGFHAVVVPSGFRTSVQPHRWMTTSWWYQHSKTQSLRLVLPPLALCVTWWTWQAAAGWLHRPAQRQCLSRRMTALRMAAGTFWLKPTSSGRLGPPSRAPSCRRRRNEASPPGPDSRSTALPIMACSRASQARVVSGPGVT